ncbi:sodium:solute symporter family protein [Haloactinomyces albus]|uniref:Sodium/pantothenate symporter n=1 Tax=Haloactinomyces albus TaxID=1352928 RepID=A0AAE3ZFK2_9ACTN|nr:sodium:solute symporter family protein [Haloactinomyces albus]MDR7304041.1 sodium/pantothenate symporter [Haloactinomyces albus]
MTLTIVLGYFAVLVVIGWYAHRKVRNSTDQYFVAGRSLGSFVNSWAFLASLASGGSIMAAVGTALALGFPYGASLVAGAPVGFAVAAIFVAGPLRELGKYTVPDYFRSRYNSTIMRWAVPITIVAASMAYIVAQLKGASLVAANLLGWDYSTGIWVTGTVFVLYVSIGGFLSVTWNDVFQGILMFAMMIGVAVAVLASLDSFGATFITATENYPALGRVSEALPISSYIGGFLTWVTAISVLPHVIMRVYSAKNVRSARMSLNVSMLLFAVMMLIAALVLTPAAATLVPDLDLSEPDAAFLALTDHVLGPIGEGIVAGAILAAIMSTTAGLLMACNSAIGHDIYSRLLRPRASEKQVVRVASAATWVVGLICMVLALNPPEFLVVLYTAAVALLASSFFAPMVLGIWWHRTTSQGATAGMVTGGILFSGAFLLFEMPSSSEVLVGLPASFLVTIVASLCTTERETAGSSQPHRVSVPEES